MVGGEKRKSACAGVIGSGEVGSRSLWKVWTEGLRNPWRLCVLRLGKERK